MFPLCYEWWGFRNKGIWEATLSLLFQRIQGWEWGYPNIAQKEEAILFRHLVLFFFFFLGILVLFIIQEEKWIVGLKFVIKHSVLFIWLFDETVRAGCLFALLGKNNPVPCRITPKGYLTSFSTGLGGHWGSQAMLFFQLAKPWLWCVVLRRWGVWVGVHKQMPDHGLKTPKGDKHIFKSTLGICEIVQ